jgi:hypothetical protein
MIDPKGTTPGLAPGAQEAPSIVNMKCADSKCASIEATEIKVEVAEHVGQRVYRCTKCGRTRSLNIGGHINI